METRMIKSEFVVSEDTAKWIRLLRSLQEIWIETSDLVDNEETFMSNFFPHFEAIEKQCAEQMAHGVLANMGWKDQPSNMI